MTTTRHTFFIIPYLMLIKVLIWDGRIFFPTITNKPSRMCNVCQHTFLADLGRAFIIFIAGKVFATNAGGDFFGMNTCKVRKYQSFTVIGASN